MDEKKLDALVGGYNQEAVQKEIAKDPRIKGKEAARIHALLKGWRG